MTERPAEMRCVRPVLVAKGEDVTVELPPITQWEDDQLIEEALHLLSVRCLKELHGRRIVRELTLSERAMNRLMRYEIETIGQLVSYSKLRLLNLPLVGIKVVQEIEEALKGLGLSLASERCG